MALAILEFRDDTADSIMFPPYVVGRCGDRGSGHSSNINKFVHAGVKKAVFPKQFVHSQAQNALFSMAFVHSRAQMFFVASEMCLQELEILDFQSTTFSKEFGNGYIFPGSLCLQELKTKSAKCSREFVPPRAHDITFSKGICAFKRLQSPPFF